MRCLLSNMALFMQKDALLILEKRPIMEYLIEDKHPLAIHAAQNQCCTTENENG
jgi:hypothetical protein